MRTKTVDDSESDSDLSDDGNDSTNRPPQRSSISDAYQNTMSALGVARDGITIGKPAAAASFNAANASVDAGFAISRQAISSSFRAASLLGLMNHERAETAQQSINSAVDMAHTVTKKSLGASATITKASLHASDSILSLTGAQQGETLRLLSQRIASHSDDAKREMGEAILGLLSLLAKTGTDLSNGGATTNPLRLVEAARRLATLHENRRQSRVQMQSRGEDAYTPLVPVASDVTSLSRHMTFAAAAYGYVGMGKRWAQLHRGSSTVPWSCDEDVIQDLTAVNRGDIVCICAGGEGMYQPAHFVAVNHKDKEVVVAIRGTMSLKDVLVDLVCENVPFSSVYVDSTNRGDDDNGDDDDEMIMEGKAHGGFLKSAQRLANTLHEPVANALSANPEYRLVIVGHSLGGGVATLLTLLWATIPLFRARNIQGYSYASPCSVCASISQAPFTRQHVTSVVYGDDLVSRLSLASFRELQRDIVATSMEEDGNTSPTNTSSDAIEEEKLYCTGKVWWLESKEYEPHQIVEVNPVEHLQHIELFSDMIATHMPWAYLDALEKLDHPNEEEDEIDFSPISCDAE